MLPRNVQVRLFNSLHRIQHATSREVYAGFARCTADMQKKVMMMYLHTEYISRQTILHPPHDRIISMYNIHYPATSKPQNSLHRNQTLKSDNSSNAFVSSERGTKEMKEMPWLYDNKKVTVFPPTQGCPICAGVSFHAVNATGPAALARP